ncbi:MAG TPA: heme exporter protein CcmD [Acidisoma sp.]|jgi:hypothetical protein|uniref:heme exporter protein CcmD n=1 Tax=Acidisoma sp. TaxID=1872115 RepID=UPI002CE89FD6|nr:heme exporter protein CcmD [Acidisoma sp.]HTI03143.1 heme exporter protein CcmD [Acidisoma sp.]
MTGTAPLWPYIAGAYGVTVVALVILGLQAWLRAGGARRRLAMLEAESPRRRGRPA